MAGWKRDLLRILNGRSSPLERALLSLSARIRARTAGGIPAPRTAHNRTPLHFGLADSPQGWHSARSPLEHFVFLVEMTMMGFWCSVATPGTVLTIHTRWTVAKPSLVSASGLGERDLSITMTLQSK